MITRGGLLGPAVVLLAGTGVAGEGGGRLLRYKPVAALSYVVVEGGEHEGIRILNIDSMEALPEQRLALRLRTHDISDKGRPLPREYRMSSRGELLECHLGAGRWSPMTLDDVPKSVKRPIIDAALYGDYGFPLLPEDEVRRKSSWEENRHVAWSGAGEAAVFVPVKVQYTCVAGIVDPVRRRRYAYLLYVLSGEAGFRGDEGGEWTVRIEASGTLEFDYENGCDVKVSKKYMAAVVDGRGVEEPTQETRWLRKELSEFPLPQQPPEPGRE